MENFVEVKMPTKNIDGELIDDRYIRGTFVFKRSTKIFKTRILRMSKDKGRRPSNEALPSR